MASKQKSRPPLAFAFASDTSDSDTESPTRTETSSSNSASTVIIDENRPLLGYTRNTAAKSQSTSRRLLFLFASVAAVLLLVFPALLIVTDNTSQPSVPTIPAPPPPKPKNISYTTRAILINNEPQLLFVATIHYPRSHPSVWPQLLHRIKLAGNNAIDTYVFWNLHEPVQGEYDFSVESANLPLFLQLANEAGLHVILRIGPYVCAEWSFGGLPVWLLDEKKFPGLRIRTFEIQFMSLMAGFIEKTLEVVDRYLASNGGPIILLQIENEYGLIANEMGPDGLKYIKWAGTYAKSLNTSVPWIMCQQNNVPTVINTVNGMYADNWIDGHRKRFPEQPALFTELWTGWFQQWGQGRFTRYAEDLAFSSARFIAKGGTYIGYYMWHGGTNFGRWGSGWKTTSYDYDALLNEYGFPNNPKHNHLADLHYVCNKYKYLILSQEPKFYLLGKDAEAHVYGNLNLEIPNDTTTALVFLSNTNSHQEADVFFGRQTFTLPQWSVSIYLKDESGMYLLYCTASPKPILSVFEEKETDPILTAVLKDLAHRKPRFKIPQLDTYSLQLSYLEALATARSLPHRTDLILSAIIQSVSYIRESVGIWDNSTSITSHVPLEQVRISLDASDYMWYVRRNIPVKGDRKANIRFEGGVQDVAHVYFDGEAVGNAGGLYDGGLSECKVPSGLTGKSYDLEIDLDNISEKWKKKNPRKRKGGNKDDDENDNHELAVLVGLAGLCNYGADMGDIQRGIKGTVKVNKLDVTKGEWLQQVGLKGERFGYHTGSKSQALWQPYADSESWLRNTPLIWFKISFPKTELLALHEKALQTQTATQLFQANKNFSNQSVVPIITFVLNLSTMGRGLAFVNGKAVGRFWNLKAECSNVPCKYPDSATAGGESCADGCGYPSQRWYNVPTAWILESGDTVEVVLFDEVGGNPLGISFGVVSG
ncbi:hypothetical protein HK100_009722 [Physocladia obscura]|uniref:Beta-galactosidase n=1 Tax=Physocladia obscura TaxID=109957 RepID=A0AAD5T315_9FUNG|nr:hypothetical protein HK100_009722 [Physocladia obscura]